MTAGKRFHIFPKRRRRRLGPQDIEKELLPVRERIPRKRKEHLAVDFVQFAADVCIKNGVSLVSVESEYHLK
jgi:hypothetical protein